MNVKFLKTWKDGIEELNTMSSNIESSRKEAEELISEKIREVFERNGTKVKSIEFSADSSIITVKLEGKTSNSIHFNKKFMFEVAMPFSVQRRLNAQCDNEMYVELYPLEDD